MSSSSSRGEARTKKGKVPCGSEVCGAGRRAPGAAALAAAGAVVLVAAALHGGARDRCEESCAGVCWSSSEAGSPQRCGGASDLCFSACRQHANESGSAHIQQCLFKECEPRCRHAPTGTHSVDSEIGEKFIASCWTICQADCEEMAGVLSTLSVEDSCIEQSKCTEIFEEEMAEVQACKHLNGCGSARTTILFAGAGFALLALAALSLAFFAEAWPDLAKVCEAAVLFGHLAWAAGLVMAIIGFVALARALEPPRDPAASPMLPIVLMARRFLWTLGAFALLGASRCCLKVSPAADAESVLAQGLVAC